MATDPTAIAQTRNASGAYGPMQAASAAGTAKIPAPTMMLMMLAASAQGPTTRLSSWSRAGSFGRACGRLPARDQGLEVLHGARHPKLRRALGQLFVDLHAERMQCARGPQPGFDGPIHRRLDLQQSGER